ncbi:glycosyltransferase family 4 protein [Duganella sp. FT3S]|uniref:Glycosyltransferase family 4 protein n=2 Tax=Rugamonas fusca TaxID=2758568 RepID=A0A7W2I8P4_9BURK|nr:glycosyltransferase family 4 protein [Rugamonas fusca]
MLGTAAAGKGGIASVVSVLQREGFMARHGVRYLATHAAGSAWVKLTTALLACWRVLVLCLLTRPAIVHAHTASRASFLRKSLMLAIARATGCRTVLHLHGAEFKTYATEEAGPLLRWWVRHSLRRSSVVIALSEQWAEFLRAYAPGAHVVVVVNSVELKPLQEGRARHGRLLFLGRADQRKGMFDLLEALALLRPSQPALQLVIGGDGDLDAVARAVHRLGLDDCVTILGWIGPERKEQELAQASIFVLPSYDEGLPMAMLEAMAAGKAVVVTPVGGIPQAVRDGHNGVLVPVGDPAALARALGRLLDDERWRAGLAAQARATVAARFSTAVVLGQLDAVYAGLGLAPAP